jgi:EAL domain-containing protein (putative c-di-GMP-specific phosphodiesterase class I)
MQAEALGAEAPAPAAALAATARGAGAEPLVARKGRGRSAAPVDAGPDAVAALEAGAIEAYFQPIVRLNDRRTVGFEALARWQLPNGEVRDAADFVPALVKAGRGVDLARTIIERAAAELSTWIAGEGAQGQFVSINISAADLPKDELADVIRAAVDTYRLPPGALVVELTEGRIQSSQSKALASAKAVRAAGASLAIDDFGVGFSTLSRLSKFHFDLVKTDRSVLEGIAGDKKRRSFLKAVLAAAAKSGSPVIAEGVEDEDTARLLEEMGCDFAQGFLFGKAEPLDGDYAAPESPATFARGPDRAPAPARGGRVSDLR